MSYDGNDWRVVLIEFDGHGRKPFHVHAADAEGRVRGFDIEHSTLYPGLYCSMSSTGGDTYLEHGGTFRWWAAPGYEPKDDSRNGRKRAKSTPVGRFSPARLMDTVNDGEGGTLCEKCNDYIPPNQMHKPQCGKGQQ